MAIWVPPLKVENRLISLCADGVQHTIGKLSIRATTCLRPHLNQRSAHKVIGPKSCKNPICGNFGIPLGSPGTKWHLGVGPVARHNYALTNLLFGLCRSVWVIEMLVNLPSPIMELQHAPLPSKFCEPRSTPQLLFLSLFSPLGSQLSLSRSLGVRHLPFGSIPTHPNPMRRGNKITTHNSARIWLEYDHAH